MSCDGTQCYHCNQRLQETFGDEWPEMSDQARLIVRISGLSYAEAVEHIIGREKQTTIGQFEEPQKVWRKLIEDIGKALETFVEPIEPPADVIERARRLYENRNIGPEHPRRHQ